MNRVQALVIVAIAACLILVIREQVSIIVSNKGGIQVRRRGGGGAFTPYEPISLIIYRSNETDEEVSNIEWGTVGVSESKETSLYLFNSGSNSLFLDMITENWNPVNASQYIGLAWNYDGIPIEPQTGRPVRLTLTIFSNATLSGITNFSFDIIILI